MRQEHWEYLLDLKETRSITATSERFHISPQALSKAIMTLEKEIGFKVLNRSHLGVSLTPEGSQALQMALIFFRDLHMIKENMEEQPQAQISEIKIPMAYSVDEKSFYSLLSQYAVLFPFSKIKFISSPLEDIIQQVANKEIDFALISMAFHSDVALDEMLKNFPIQCHPCMSRNIYAMVSKRLPLSKYKTISLKTFLKQNTLLFAKDKKVSHSLFGFFPDLGFEYPQRCDIEDDYKIFLNKMILGNYVSLGIEDRENYTNTFLEAVNLIPLREKVQIVICYICHADNDIHQFVLPHKHLKFLNIS